MPLTVECINLANAYSGYVHVPVPLYWDALDETDDYVGDVKYSEDSDSQSTEQNKPAINTFSCETMLSALVFSSVYIVLKSVVLMRK